MANNIASCNITISSYGNWNVGLNQIHFKLLPLQLNHGTETNSHEGKFQISSAGLFNFVNTFVILCSGGGGASSEDTHMASWRDSDWVGDGMETQGFLPLGTIKLKKEGECRVWGVGRRTLELCYENEAGDLGDKGAAEQVERGRRPSGTILAPWDRGRRGWNSMLEASWVAELLCKAPMCMLLFKNK